MPKGGSWWLDFYGFVRIFTALLNRQRDEIVMRTERR